MHSVALSKDIPTTTTGSGNRALCHRAVTKPDNYLEESIMATHIKSRVEETIILALLGAAVAVTVVSILATGASGYLPTTAVGMASEARAILLWVAAVIGLIVGGSYGLVQERDTHLRGARYYAEEREAAPVLQAMQREQMSDDQLHHRVRGIDIAGIELAMRTELAHLYIAGLTGGGKTVLLAWIIH